MELINRAELLAEIENNHWEDGDPKDIAIQIVLFASTIETATAAYGIWELIGMRPTGTCYTHCCSICGGHGNEDMAYCPSCGAIME